MDDSLNTIARDDRYFELRDKHVRQYDAEFLAFGQADNGMSVLEFGAATGIFLRYLKAKGFKRVAAVDGDPRIAHRLAELKEAGFEIHISDAEAYVDQATGKKRFDRVVMFDFLEHLPLDYAVRFLTKLHGILEPGAKLVIRVPNGSSPWGLRMQFGTFEHVTVLTPDRLRELAAMTGFHCAEVRGQATGKKRKRLVEKLLHGFLSRILTYHPDIWEAALLCRFEKP